MSDSAKVLLILRDRIIIVKKIERTIFQFWNNFHHKTYSEAGYFEYVGDTIRILKERFSEH